MTKKQFIKSLEEIIDDKIFITDNVEQLNKEISENCWSISTNQEVINQLSSNDLSNVISRVKSNRLSQLNQSQLEVGLIFYLWFDEQSSQLKFNLINSNHKKLPFKTRIKLVLSEVEIFEEFLNSKNHNGIPFEELHEASAENKDIIEENILKVYKVKLE